MPAYRRVSPALRARARSFGRHRPQWSPHHACDRLAVIITVIIIVVVIISSRIRNSRRIAIGAKP